MIMSQPAEPQSDEQTPAEPVDDGWARVSPTPVPLILEQEQMGAGIRLTPQPGRALLLADRDGRLVQAMKYPNPFAARRYQWQYEVDVADHFTVHFVELPSRSKGAKFRLSIDVGWRVSDPVRIVTSRIDDGNAIVRSRVIEALLPICRSYRIEEDGALEQNLVAALGGGREHVYPEGITLFRFSAQVNHDQRSSRWIEAHVDAVQETELTKQGMAGLRDQVTSEVDLILLSLQRNPDQVQQVISEIRQRKEMSVKSRIELFNKMVENDLVQEAEIDSLRRQIIEPMGDIVGSNSAGAFGIEQLPQPVRRAIDHPAEIALPIPDDDEEEDVLPAEIVESSVDGVSSWRPAPWQRDQDREDT
jgi:hypothetical protein